ncbi:MAG: hypothetical protein K5798_08290 [Nitrosopumilus sp.]|uniref:HEPN domain-containing protein n=1 Tax=Nitrosopumilus sp. TaxID=2024843 RepID=UPI00242D0232|nr:HEPN domain-containing protein [Nitrosopumilus sp.]MCV0367241.1 hypothetical protein [Nitrosopumilus sp.]
MFEYRDKDLYLSFTNLFRLVIDTLNKKLESDFKESLSDIEYPSLFRVFRKYFEIIRHTDEFKKFEQVLLKNEKYSKNFTGKYKMQEYVWSKSIEGMIEGLFIEHLRKNGLSDDSNTIDDYYSELEVFLIDEKIKTIIKTPVLGLRTSSQLIEINKQVSLIQLNGQRPVSYNESTDIIKYVYAFHDLVYEYFTDKIVDKDQNVEDLQNSWQTKRAQIRDLLIVLRLYRNGKIGFLDSHLSHSIFHGGQSWQNFDCDLEADWSKWDREQHPYILQSTEVVEINKLWNELHKIDFSINKNKFLLIAINRFMISYEKENPEDKILDLMICLESLLQDEQGELRFRLSIRTALFLETDKSKRNRVYKVIKKGYDIRSAIAHGGDASVIKIDEEEITLENLVVEIEEYVRRSIKEFIKQLNDNRNRGAIIQKLDANILL